MRNLLASESLLTLSGWPATDALDLRPENALALHYARMSSGHRDLLSTYLPHSTSVVRLPSLT